MAAAGAISTPSASADNYPVIEKFGTQEKLVDGAGAVVQGWTVAYVQSSSDSVPWPVRGALWESSATEQAIRGTVAPIISDFNAQAANGQSYQALAGPTRCRVQRRRPRSPLLGQIEAATKVLGAQGFTVTLPGSGP